jgi:hypothetical protein
VQLGLPVERKALDLSNWGLPIPFAVAWRHFTRYYNSNFAALPAEGGLEDQDADTMDALDTLGLLVDFHMHRLKPKRGGRGHDQDNEEDEPPVQYGVE